VRVVAGAASDVGRVREGNEDAFLVDDRLALFAVADGMGGHQAGEVASATALEALRAAVASDQPINEAVVTANRAVYEMAAENPEMRGMGTTLTALVTLGGNRLLIGHVGDSRAYLLREGALRKVTDDHSLVEELVRDGRLTPEQAEVHPQRSIITRALGIDADVEVDLYTVDVGEGDRVLLCSDGLTTMVRDREIARIVRTEPDVRLAADKLVDAANDAGGEDNVTVVVLDVVEVDPEASEALDADAVVEAPPAAPPPAATPAEAAPTEAVLPKPRRVRAVVLTLLPIAVILGVAFGALAWYARRSYYVSQLHDRVVVYRGVPGGFLLWSPTVDDRTDVRVSDLPPYERQRVTAAQPQVYTSRAKAEARVDTLRTATTTTTTSTTTTTAQPRTAPATAPGTRPKPVTPPTTRPPTPGTTTSP